MQTRSNTWKELAEAGDFEVETKAVIAGTEYTSISAPVITRALADAPLTIGKAVSASLQMSILTEDTIPQSAQVVIYKRLTDGITYSEWLPCGTFFIAKRAVDRVTGLISLQCYDSMLKANAPFLDASYIDATVNGQQIITAVIQALGVQIEDATAADIATLSMTYTNIVTIQQVLEWAAEVLGGIFFITPDNMLRLAKLKSSTKAATDSNRLQMLAIVGKLNTDASIEVTGLTGVDVTGATRSYGDATGAVIRLTEGNPFLTQSRISKLWKSVKGIQYQPYTIDGGYYDPAAELGDYITSREDVASLIISETATYDLGFRGNLSAPGSGGIEDEYPYSGMGDKINTLEGQVQQLVTVVADKASIREIEALYAKIASLSVEDIQTGVIHSNDYETYTVPLIYPASDLYPSKTTNPSDGHDVLHGFAIDFSTGKIFGAFYSEQIDALTARVEDLERRVKALEDA